MNSKIIKLIYYSLIILVSGVLYYSSQAANVVEKVIGDNEGGVLITTYKKLAVFFEHATIWNIIFLILFISFALLFLMIYLQLLRWGLNRIKRWLKWEWFHNTWVDIVEQITLPFAALVFVFLTFVFGSLGIMTYHANKRSLSLNEVSKIEGKTNLLILGTSKMLRTRPGENAYFKYRIKSGLDLWNTGKVNNIIISGDKETGTDYDETRDMRQDLIAGGVPEQAIKLDTAGFRTLDSILRLKYEFNFNQVVVVTEMFHLKRALFLSKLYGVTAWGFPDGGTPTWGMVKRELGAKPKVLLDMFVFNTQPRLLSAQGGAYNIQEEFKVETDRDVAAILSLFAFALVTFIGTIKMI